METTDGRLLRRHVNHIRLCHSSLSTAMESTDRDDWSDSVPATASSTTLVDQASHPPAISSACPLRRSHRTRRPPSYFINENTS